LGHERNLEYRESLLQSCFAILEHVLVALWWKKCLIRLASCWASKYVCTFCRVLHRSASEYPNQRRSQARYFVKFPRCSNITGDKTFPLSVSMWRLIIAQRIVWTCSIIWIQLSLFLLIFYHWHIVSLQKSRREVQIHLGLRW
jgi:hypothetical protein